MIEHATFDPFQAAFESVLSYGGYVDADIVGVDSSELQGVSVKVVDDERGRAMIYREYFDETAPGKPCGIYAKHIITVEGMRAGIVCNTFRRPNIDGDAYDYIKDPSTKDKAHEAAWQLIESALGRMALLPEPYSDNT